MEAGTPGTERAGPETSVIIRAYNEEKYLPGLLDTLEKQTYQDFEVILVDSGSFDRTRQIAAEAGARVLRIDSRDFTFGHSLNVGIEAARGRYAAIVSAHTEPVSHDWLESLVRPLRDKRVAMVYGRQHGTSDSKFAEFQDFRRRFGPERKRHTSQEETFANNANSAVRKELWSEHPFDEALPGLEDIAWALHWVEEGYQVHYEPEAGIYHYHEETWGQVFRRYYREALAAKWIGIHGPGDIPLVIADEGRRLLQDLFLAARRGELAERTSRILRFRYEKAKGTVNGLRDGAALDDPRQAEEMYFEDAYEAVVIDRPGNVRLTELELGEVKPGDVLIRVGYVGVCETDLKIYNGTLGYYKEGEAEYPIVPGHEFSGTVVQAGPKVDDLESGERVVAECIQTCLHCPACRQGSFLACKRRRELGVMGLDGAYAGYVTVPGEFVHAVPPAITAKEAALVEPLAVVLKGLGKLQQLLPENATGQEVAVVGAGPIGHLTALVLDERGHKPTVYERNADRRRAIARVMDIPRKDKLTGLDEYRLLVEATGNPEALDQVLTESPPGASILLLGLPYGERRFNFEKLVGYDKTVMGSVGSSSEEFEKAIRSLPSLVIDQLTDEVLPLAEFREAWTMVRRKDALKVLLRVEPDSPGRG